MLRALTLDVLKLAAEGGLVFYDWAPDGLVCVAFIVLLVQYCWAEKKKGSPAKQHGSLVLCLFFPSFLCPEVGIFSSGKDILTKSSGRCQVCANCFTEIQAALSWGQTGQWPFSDTNGQRGMPWVKGGGWGDSGCPWEMPWGSESGIWVTPSLLKLARNVGLMVPKLHEQM